MDILRQIIEERRADVARAAADVPIDSLQRAAAARVHHSLTDRLRQSGVCVIAEMKKASPSAGLLRETYQPQEIARTYEQGGAEGISVLTEPRHFQGRGDDLRQVRMVTSLPLLRKDFVCDRYHVYEAAAWGADVVLLIVAALATEVLEELYAEARCLGLEVLIESHTATELEVALRFDEAIVGVNSRNLKTLTTDLATARSLAGRIPSGRLSVAESGIRTGEDIRGLCQLGYNGFLVGESLMGAADPLAVLSELIQG